MRPTGLYTTSISGSSNSPAIVIDTLPQIKYVNPRTLVRAGTAIGLGDTMFLRERIRTTLIPCGDSLHHRIGMVFDWINERDGCDTCSAEDAESQGGLGRCFRSGRVAKLQHSGM